MSALTRSSAWHALEAHYEQVRDVHMRDLFRADAKRFESFSLRLGDFLVDYSKNRVTAETMRLLAELARQAGVPEQIGRMFGGEKINFTENRAVLHTALRNRSGRPVFVEGVDVMPKVGAVLARMRTFSSAVRNGDWKGYTGKKITDIVNIGIGGSDLGPAMVTRALRPYVRTGLRVHFVSNVDGTQIAETLKRSSPETDALHRRVEDLHHPGDDRQREDGARVAVQSTLGDEGAVAKHFVALSTNAREVAPSASTRQHVRVLGLGRRPLLALERHRPVHRNRDRDGPLRELLEGAHAMDEHFRTAPIEQNLPVVLMGCSASGTTTSSAPSHAILPYDQYLHRFPPTSSRPTWRATARASTAPGKSGRLRRPVRSSGASRAPTGSTRSTSSSIRARARPRRLHRTGALSHNPLGTHHKILLSNFFAQTEALMRGKTEDEVRAELDVAGLGGDALERLLPHKVFEGNRPTNSILFRSLTPYSLGVLLAMYEHKIFTQGVIWDINSFDQWGVELGKQLAEVNPARARRRRPRARARRLDQRPDQPLQVAEVSAAPPALPGYGMPGKRTSRSLSIPSVIS
jgi:glucose-6-phosphate isomerase